MDSGRCQEWLSTGCRQDTKGLRSMFSSLCAKVYVRIERVIRPSLTGGGQEKRNRVELVLGPELIQEAKRAREARELRGPS